MEIILERNKEMFINKKSLLTILVVLLIVATIGVVLNIITPEQKGSFVSAEKAIEIIAREGFCLSEIAQDLGTDWREIAELNGINPDRILSGQKIEVHPFNKTNIVKASWYGPGFHGKLMSNRKIFDMNDATVVAHKWLPFGTKVRLIRVDNNKSIVVIVQDRGPYVKGRIFDLSKGAAELLGMIDDGVTTCKVEILN